MGGGILELFQGQLSLQVSLYFPVATIRVTLGHFKADMGAFVPRRSKPFRSGSLLKQTPTAAGAGSPTNGTRDFLHKNES